MFPYVDKNPCPYLINHTIEVFRQSKLEGFKRHAKPINQLGSLLTQLRHSNQSLDAISIIQWLPNVYKNKINMKYLLVKQGNT